jgi:3-hydroxy-9,10-secoandrosta-1,3,5(10)-triene-9,17-dione monooxygenase reductase component
VPQQPPAQEPAAEPAVAIADEVAFREAIAHFATGVTVITTMHEGKPAGMTASAVSSLDPVLLLVCVNNRIPTHTAIESHRRFVVNVLGEGQETLALQFARSGTDKFQNVALDPDHELPVLADAIAYFICDVHERFPGGDHSIFTGLVRECGAVPGKQPLLYFKSRFGILRDPNAEILQETLGWDMPSLSGLALFRPTTRES